MKHKRRQKERKTGTKIKTKQNKNPAKQKQQDSNIKSFPMGDYFKYNVLSSSVKRQEWLKG